MNQSNFQSRNFNNGSDIMNNMNLGKSEWWKKTDVLQLFLNNQQYQFNRHMWCGKEKNLPIKGGKHFRFFLLSVLTVRNWTRFCLSCCKCLCALTFSMHSKPISQLRKKGP